MLVYNKIHFKKLITSVTIIIIMFGGSFYFVYKNNKLMDVQKISIIKIMQPIITKSSSKKTLNIISAKLKDKIKITNDVTVIEEKILNLFSNIKFKSLEILQVSSPSYSVGRKNPFESYQKK